MTHAASELAYRTAMTAGPFVDTLTGDMRQIACCLRQGDLGPALVALEASTDRLQRFLTFLVVSSEVLLEDRAAVGAVVADYGRRMLGVVSRIEDALEQQDLVGLALTLEHGLAGGLAEYRGYEDDVTRALGALNTAQVA